MHKGPYPGLVSIWQILNTPASLNQLDSTIGEKSLQLKLICAEAQKEGEPSFVNAAVGHGIRLPTRKLAARRDTAKGGREL